MIIFQDETVKHEVLLTRRGKIKLAAGMAAAALLGFATGGWNIFGV